MKILLANKYYYLRGGDCIYTIELEKLLKSYGHKVAIFSMQHPNNLESNYNEYFPSEVDFAKKSFGSLFKAFTRPFGSKEVKKKLSQLLQKFEPDIVHLNNIHSQLSPILAEISYKKNIPVIWTLHDYKLLCPAHSCLRYKTPCKLCFNNKINVLKYRCVKGILGSIIAFLEAKCWNRKKIEKYTTRYIAPSHFLKSKMIEGDFDAYKITANHNFIAFHKFVNEFTPKELYYCYVGRLSQEKGVETLITTAIKIKDYKLKIIGTGPLHDKLKNKYNYPHIEFVGFKKWEELKIFLQKARFMVLPSECYENNPLSAIEAFSQGTPVLGANIGGIPELIKPNINGLLFEPGNPEDLKAKIHKMFAVSFDYGEIVNDAKKKYSSEGYYHNIHEIYQQAINRI